MKPNHLWALVVFSLLNNGLAAQHEDSLLVDCKNALTQQLIRDPKDFSQVEFVQIVGLDVSCDWNEIFNSLSQLPQLRSLVMDRNALNNLPDGVQKLKTL